MISITTKSPYALQALAELGRSGDGPVPIGELARRREIPVQFLEQLFAVLRRAGVLQSQRGVNFQKTRSRIDKCHRPAGSAHDTHGFAQNEPERFLRFERGMNDVADLVEEIQPVVAGLQLS